MNEADRIPTPIQVPKPTRAIAGIGSIDEGLLRIPNPTPGPPRRLGPRGKPHDPELARRETELSDLRAEHSYLVMQVEARGLQTSIPAAAVSAWVDLDGVEPTDAEIAHTSAALSDGIGAGPSMRQAAGAYADVRLAHGAHDSDPFEALGAGPCQSDSGQREAARVLGQVVGEIEREPIPKGETRSAQAWRMRAWTARAGATVRRMIQAALIPEIRAARRRQVEAQLRRRQIRTVPGKRPGRGLR